MELAEKIEQYLTGQLSEVDKAGFEAQMAGDIKLSEDVRLQRQTMQGLERIVLKQKIKKARIRYKLYRYLTRWGIPVLLGIVIVFSVLIYKSNLGSYQSFLGKSGLSYHSKLGSFQSLIGKNALPELNEAGGKNWADADKNIEAQTFFIDASVDTVIETAGGIVLSVPANAFLDSLGKTVSGKVEFVFKEALTPSDIINAGLSTTSGGKLLETGGMFFVDARKDGAALKINAKKGIYAEIPTESVKSGMKLFAGKRKADGSIDWVNPRPLEHDVVSVDILSLDFYPPHYLDSLAKWGYGNRGKKFDDSLYYSLAAKFGDLSEEMDRASKPAPQAPASAFANEEFDGSLAPVKKISIKTSERAYTDTVYSLIALALSKKVDSVSFQPQPCGINPAKIKTIWSEKFQNTILSTREFQERLYLLHKFGNDGALDLYVNNLDRPLYQIDSMVAAQSEGKLKERFLEFAATHTGTVNNGSRQFKKLREYYRRQAKLCTDAILKTQAEFRNKKLLLDNESDTKKEKHQNDSAKRADQAFSEEFNLNLKEAYRQLGYKGDIPIRSRLSTKKYSVNITNTGWCNVDRFVDESVRNRATLNFTDSESGKTAVIKYLPVSFSIDESTKYDQVYVYLLPDKLSSFMRVAGSNGKYSGKLNELINYKLVCVAYKEGEAFLYTQNHVESKNYAHIALLSTGKKEMDHVLNNMSNNGLASAIQKENEFLKFEIADEKRRKYNMDNQELTDKLVDFIFPCYADLPKRAPVQYQRPVAEDQ